MSRNLATLIGFTAVLLWAILAALTMVTLPTPPLALNAICFAIGGGLGLIWLGFTGGFRALLAVPLSVYAFGTAGLFGYHFFYFSALRLVPPAEASLINYLWPLLIVLGSSLLPGERLRPLHVAGAGLAFLGAALIILKGGGGEGGLKAGHLLAALAALTWAGYSLLSRRFGAVPTAAVVFYCLATAVLSALAHLALETPAWPDNAAGWLAILALGLGPVGLAFFTWDIGVKRGDIQLLGTASYAAPLLSTLALILAGFATASWELGLATALIAGGAILAARAGRKGKSAPE